LIGVDASMATQTGLEQGTPRPRARPVRALRAFYELTKPGIARMVVLTAAAGYYLGSAAPFDVIGMLHALVGTGLAASGSLALNQYAEREIDCTMGRTCGRPLPSGRLKPITAVLFGLLLSVVGVLYLAVFANVLTAALVTGSIATYVIVYTPMKRRSWTATLVGAVPGALPVLAGWTAARGSISAGGMVLFAILFLWQMPHFYALAWMYRDDYRQAGFRLLTVDDVSGVRTVRHILGFTIALVAVSAAPALIGLTGTLYLAGATALGAAFYLLARSFARERSEQRALRLFLGSVVYLPLLLLLMVVDRLI
jgi:protoheme IX farnesyltransferase